MHQCINITDLAAGKDGANVNYMYCQVVPIHNNT